MANTVFKIKRALAGGNAVPANGALAQGELGFSYNGNNLFIGDTTGAGAPILLTSVKTVAGQSPVAGNIAVALSNLSDVALSSPANGQYLTYNGTSWVNTPAPTSGVSSVNGQTGVVVLTTTDIAEGTNLYYTDAAVDARIVAATGVTIQAHDAGLDSFSALTGPGFVTVDATGNVVSARQVTGSAGNIAVTAGGDGSADVVIDLVNAGTAVTAQFVKITTDTKGRVTATTAVTAADIEASLTFTPVNKAGDTMTGELLLANSTPSVDAAAASKGYVDAVAAGLSWKTSVKAASTGALTLSGAQTVDAIALVAGDRVLVKNQAAPAANGIYVVAAGAWARATDMDSTTPINEINGAAVFVEQGTANGGKGYTQVDQVTVLGTDPIVWALFSSTTAGVGSVAGTAGRITSTGGTAPVIDIDAAYVGQTSLTTLGTVTTGTWNGTPVAPAFGGTGLTSYTIGDLIFASGTTTLATLADAATGNVLLSGGAGVAPAYGKVGLATHTSGQLSLTTQVTGVLPIANGGTGAATAAAAFDALSPMATDGDLITRAAGTAARVAVGTTGQVLTVVGGAPTWAAPASTVQTFTDLTDTPANYTGAATYFVAVNSAGTALEFVNTIDGGSF